jgi:hypothetical protein
MKGARALTDRVAAFVVEKPRAPPGGMPPTKSRSIHWLKPELLCEVTGTLPSRACATTKRLVKLR